MKKQTSNTVPLLVTTEHKGVFFGYGHITQDKIIRLENARMCVYWAQDVRGIIGLAATGPTSGCRITAPCPAITLQGVTSIIEVSKEAEEKWAQATWK